MTTIEAQDEGLKWQVGVWDRISGTYLREVDARFAPVIDGVIRRAELKPGERVLDLGTGTGSVAINPDSPDEMASGQFRAPISIVRSSSYAGSSSRVLTDPTGERRN